MSWVSTFLPASSERLTNLEWWLWAAVLFFAVLAAVVGFSAREVGRYRAPGASGGDPH